MNNLSRLRIIQTGGEKNDVSSVNERKRLLFSRRFIQHTLNFLLCVFSCSHRKSTRYRYNRKRCMIILSFSLYELRNGVFDGVYGWRLFFDLLFSLFSELLDGHICVCVLSAKETQIFR